MIKANTLNNPDFLPANSNGGIDEILRGEISAMEAYEQVYEEIRKDPEIARLDQLCEDHRNAVEYWKNQSVLELNYPEKTSGVWGTAVEAFVGASKLLGNRSALTALKKGEELGLDNYRDILESAEFTPSQKKEVREKFIPRQEEHISNLNALIKLH